NIQNTSAANLCNLQRYVTPFSVSLSAVNLCATIVPLCISAHCTPPQYVPHDAMAPTGLLDEATCVSHLSTGLRDHIYTRLPLRDAPHDSTNGVPHDVISPGLYGSTNRTQLDFRPETSQYPTPRSRCSECFAFAPAMRRALHWLQFPHHDVMLAPTVPLTDVNSVSESTVPGSLGSVLAEVTRVKLLCESDSTCRSHFLHVVYSTYRLYTPLYSSYNRPNSRCIRQTPAPSILHDSSSTN
ncbi:hypothetical protein FPQ18DRAFT_417993, partial [Pyronema domesticum]